MKETMSFFELAELEAKLEKERNRLLQELEEKNSLILKQNLKLLRQGKDLDKDGIVECMFDACFSGDISVLKLCLERLGPEAKSALELKHSAKVHGRMVYLRPLSIAIYSHYTPICRYLVLQQNVEITFDILKDAGDSDNSEIFLFLMKNFKIDSIVDANLEFTKLLYQMLPTATVDMVDVVLKAGADPFLRLPRVSHSCFGLAIKYDKEEIFKLLLKMKPNINLRSETIHLDIAGHWGTWNSMIRATPLLLAASLNKGEFARMLLDHKEMQADVNDHHPNVPAPIFFFAHYDIENKSSPKANSLFGLEPIDPLDNFEVMLTLLEHKASIDIGVIEDDKYFNAKEVIEKVSLSRGLKESLIENRKKYVHQLLGLGIFGQNVGVREAINLIAGYAVDRQSLSSC